MKHLGKKKTAFDPENPICRRTYFYLQGMLASPLLIGSGENEETDADLLIDGFNHPFLPGSSIAGVLRCAAERIFGAERADNLFGDRLSEKNRARQSKLVVYDADLTQAVVGRRDGVRLDENKTAADMAKFDMQIVEAGARFSLCIELIERANDDEPERAFQEIQTLLLLLARGEITLGAKSRRGFGRLTAGSAQIKRFAMNEAAEREKWLEWHWRKENAFSDAPQLAPDAQGTGQTALERCLIVPLRLKHTLLIRRYAASSDETADYYPLSRKKNGASPDKNVPVIPGSAWAGALRARIAAIMQTLYPERDYAACQRKLAPLFGPWAEQSDTPLFASPVKAEESELSDARYLPVTRIAIDRFTGGAAAGALYTAEVAAHGQARLVLRWPIAASGGQTDAMNDDEICGALLWAIKDLQAGYLAIGGETAVGRGIFTADAERPLTLDGQTLSIEQESRCLRAAARWCAREEDANGN